MLEEDRERRAAIKAQNQQAYLKRAQRRNQRKVPDWIRERDAQLKANRAKATASGEFVIHVKRQQHRPSKRSVASFVDLPKEALKPMATANAFAALDSSDDEQVVEDFPVLMGKEVSVRPAVWPRKPPVKAAVSFLGDNVETLMTPPPSDVVIFHEDDPPSEISSGDEMEKPVLRRSSNAWVPPQRRLNGCGFAKVHPESDEEKEEIHSLQDLKRDPSMFNADGTAKSWADMMDEEEDEEEERSQSAIWAGMMGR